jgi:hypothetical protein
MLYGFAFIIYIVVLDDFLNYYFYLGKTIVLLYLFSGCYNSLVTIYRYLIDLSYKFFL